YAAVSQWQVVLLFVCELLAVENKRDYLEELFLALFGKDFGKVSGESDEGVARGELLARLVADPHAGWDEKAGWDDPLRCQALAMCCKAEGQAQRIVANQGDSATEINRTLLARYE